MVIAYLKINNKALNINIYQIIIMLIVNKIKKNFLKFGLKTMIKILTLPYKHIKLTERRNVFFNNQKIINIIIKKLMEVISIMNF